MVKLDSPEKIQQALNDIKFRMNSMMAYDIYNYLFKKYEQKNKNEKLTSIYCENHLLDPSYEIAIVFGRQLLDFLQIGHNLNRKKYIDKLDDPLVYKNNIKDDDLFLSSFPGVTTLPLQDPLIKRYDRQIKSIIKVANKASAHLTFSHTTEQEFLDVREIKPIIHDLCIKYVPNLPQENLWWLNKDNMKNAHIEK